MILARSCSCSVGGGSGFDQWCAVCFISDVHFGLLVWVLADGPIADGWSCFDFCFVVFPFSLLSLMLPVRSSLPFPFDVSFVFLLFFFWFASYVVLLLSLDVIFVGFPRNPCRWLELLIDFLPACFLCYVVM